MFEMMGSLSLSNTRLTVGIIVLSLFSTNKWYMTFCAHAVGVLFERSMYGGGSPLSGALDGDLVHLFGTCSESVVS